MIDYSTPRYRTSEVAKAAGVSHATMRSYFQRGQWRVIGKPAEGEGLPNLFSLRDAMTFAVAARLIAVTNADPKRAFDIAALDFAHTGDEQRDPGAMFDVHQHGMTLLLYWPETQTAELKAGDNVNGLFDILNPTWNSPQETVTVIVLNYLERRVFTTLSVRSDG